MRRTQRDTQWKNPLRAESPESLCAQMTSRFCRLTAMHEISVSSLCLPLGLFWSAALVAMVTGESFNINLGPAFILVLLVFLIPLVHLFVSTSRMRREAEDREQ